MMIAMSLTWSQEKAAKYKMSKRETMELYEHHHKVVP